MPEDLNHKKILIVQTAFIGDVILATSLVENLKDKFPGSIIHFLLRNGNERLLTGNTNIDRIHIWNKKGSKYLELLRVLMKVRRERYHLVVNIQRFFSTGFLTAFSRARIKVGYDKNPWSAFFTKKYPHSIGNAVHETERNHVLIQDYVGSGAARPKLFIDSVSIPVKDHMNEDYICLAPKSVWYTKQFPEEKWIEFIGTVPGSVTIYLLGGPDDTEMCERIIRRSKNKNIKNLAGKLDFLESAALMKGARMNYVNDSAPLHMASAVNAAVTAIFCSTVPEFGFGPLSDNSRVVQVKQELDCRPCGLHGKRSCPEGHFKCAMDIDIHDLKYS